MEPATKAPIPSSELLEMRKASISPTVESTKPAEATPANPSMDMALNLEFSATKLVSATSDPDGITGTFFWAPPTSASKEYDSGLWTPKKSIISQSRLSQISTVRPSSEPATQESSVWDLPITTQPAWGVSSWTSTMIETWTLTSTISGSYGSPGTVVTEVFVTSTTTIGVNVSTTVASTITTLVIASSGATQQLRSSPSPSGLEVGWYAWTPDHRAGVTMGAISGFLVVVGLLVIMWRMHKNRKSVGEVIEDVEGGRRGSNILRKALVSKKPEKTKRDGRSNRKGERARSGLGGIGGGSRREGGDGKDSLVTSTGLQGVDSISGGVTPESRSSTPIGGVDAGSRSLSRGEIDESPHLSASGDDDLSLVENKSIYSSQSTDSSSSSDSSSSTVPLNPFSSAHALEITTDTQHPPTARLTQSRMLIRSFDSFQLAELPSLFRGMPSPTSTAPAPDELVNVVTYAHRRAASNRLQSRALGHGVPLHVVRRHPMLGRSKSNAVRSVPTWEYGASEGSVQVCTTPREHVRYASAVGRNVRVYGSLRERLDGKYPARWG